MTFRKKGQVTQEYRDVVWLCTDKIRRAKAQLEFDLAAMVKDSRKYFFLYKYINKKRRTKENLHPCLGESEKVVTRKGEKNRILNVFFASVFIVYHFIVRVPSSLSWKAEAECRMEHL